MAAQVSRGFHRKSCRTAIAETHESTDEKKTFPMGCRVHTAVVRRSSLRPGRVRTPGCGKDSQHHDYACADGCGGHVQWPPRAEERQRTRAFISESSGILPRRCRDETDLRLRH